MQLTILEQSIRINNDLFGLMFIQKIKNKIKWVFHFKFYFRDSSTTSL